MTDAWHSVKIRSFEHVTAGPSITLLRLAGKAARRRHIPEARPTLVADDGRVVRRFTAIPSPPDARGILRAAYSMASELVTRETVFSLELADGFVIALPSPTPGAARLMEPPEAGEQTPPSPQLETAAPPARADDRRSDMVGKLAEQSAALAQAEQEVSEGEAARAASRADAEQARRRAQELEAHVAGLVAEAAAAADAREHIESLELSNLALQDSIAEQQERVRTLEREAGDALKSRTELEHEIEAMRAANDRVRHELREALGSTRIMTVERDELTRQAAAFDAVATKARERAVHAEAAHEESSAALRELQIWREELERRLAATTTDLAEATAAHQDNEREVKRLRGELAEAEARVEVAQVRIDSLHERLSARENAGAAPGDPASSAELQGTASEPATLRAAHPDPAEIELLRQIAEADARELAEREVADAARAGDSAG